MASSNHTKSNQSVGLHTTTRPQHGHHLNHADHPAARLRMDANINFTTFGLTNVQIHRMSPAALNDSHGVLATSDIATSTLRASQGTPALHHAQRPLGRLPKVKINSLDW